MLKRSKNVTLTILTAIALAACDDQDIKHCVDENGVVQDETTCNPTTDDGGVNPTYHPGFRWYYGGTRSTWTPGTRVSGGSYTPTPHVDYSPPSIGRGGFGATGEGFGAGAGE
jgi:hypothetical protein